jgi:hypothetical protein
MVVHVRGRCWWLRCCILPMIVRALGQENGSAVMSASDGALRLEPLAGRYMDLYCLSRIGCDLQQG